MITGMEATIVPQDSSISRRGTCLSNAAVGYSPKAASRDPTASADFPDFPIPQIARFNRVFLAHSGLACTSNPVGRDVLRILVGRGGIAVRGGIVPGHQCHV